VTVVNDDGSVTVTTEDGKETIITAEANSDGSTTATLTDGTAITMSSDGKTITKLHGDRYTDGANTKTTTNADGSITTAETSASGTSRSRTVSVDGEVSTSISDTSGSSSATSADGKTTTLTDTDGTTTTTLINDDGSVTTTSADGTKTTAAAETNVDTISIPMPKASQCSKSTTKDVYRPFCAGKDRNLAVFSFPGSNTHDPEACDLEALAYGPETVSECIDYCAKIAGGPPNCRYARFDANTGKCWIAKDCPKLFAKHAAPGVTGDDDGDGVDDAAHLGVMQLQCSLAKPVYETCRWAQSQQLRGQMLRLTLSGEWMHRQGACAGTGGDLHAGVLMDLALASHMRSNMQLLACAKMCKDDGDCASFEFNSIGDSGGYHIENGTDIRKTSRAQWGFCRKFSSQATDFEPRRGVSCWTRAGPTILPTPSPAPLCADIGIDAKLIKASTITELTCAAAKAAGRCAEFPIEAWQFCAKSCNLCGEDLQSMLAKVASAAKEKSAAEAEEAAAKAASDADATEDAKEAEENTPTNAPTNAPTKAPTNAPTKAPTNAPTKGLSMGDALMEETANEAVHGCQDEGVPSEVANDCTEVMNTGLCDCAAGAKYCAKTCGFCLIFAAMPPSPGPARGRRLQNLPAQEFDRRLSTATEATEATEATGAVEAETHSFSTFDDLLGGLETQLDQVTGQNLSVSGWDSDAGSSLTGDANSPSTGSSNVPAVHLEGWILSKAGQSCDTACAAENLSCSTKEMHKRNHLVDTTGELLDMVATLGGETPLDTATLRGGDICSMDSSEVMHEPTQHAHTACPYSMPIQHVPILPTNQLTPRYTTPFPSTLPQHRFSPILRAASRRSSER
jgi:hypothetical protein